MAGDGKGNGDEGGRRRLEDSALGCWAEEDGGVDEDGSFIVVGEFGIGVFMTRGMMRYRRRTCRGSLKDIFLGLGSVGICGMYVYTPKL